MTTLRTMNRRRWRKENPVIEACDAPRHRADGSIAMVFVGVRANRYVRFSPKPVVAEFDEVHGVEEGQVCERNGCKGVLALEPASWFDGCSCFLSAPCSYCMSKAPECPHCGWRAEEPE